MIPKLHAKGKSFKGAAAYLLHDKNKAATSGRVAWVETVNLATPNPQAAWRVMAATAMGAARLKDEAGVKKSGRSSKDAVLHFSLSWEPSQKPTREEMSDFAMRAIKALKAGDRQAMIICHTDEKHPHVHVLLNRVSPVDGRMLSSSNEKLALSELALAYEKETGAVLCKEREVNAAKRKKGQHVRGQKDIPRPEFEAMREAQKQAVSEIPAHIAAKHPEAAAKIKADIRSRVRQNLDQIKERLRPQWQALYQRQAKERGKGQAQKSSFVNRLVGWFKSGDKTKFPALAFQRQSVNGGLWNDKLREAKHRNERAALGRFYQVEARKLFGEVRTACQMVVRQIFVVHDKGGSSPKFNPAAVGTARPSPAPQLAQDVRPQPDPPPQQPQMTDAQKARAALAEKFRKEGNRIKTEPKPYGPGWPRDRDRDYEP